MSKHEVIPAGQLVYGGVTIREKGEMLSLTDMWKAAGSPDNREPFNWSRKEGAAFIDAVSVSLNLPDSQVYRATRGKHGGGTLGHWQIAIAYAKYLSHDFHMWCGSVVRAHMEGAPVNPSGLSRDDYAVIGNIVKNCTGVILREQLVSILPALVDAEVKARLAEGTMLLRRGKTAKQIWDAAGLPAGIKGATVWFGNRLAKGGCMLEGRADRGDGAVRLFDPDKGETLLGLGLLHKAKVYASERMGQGRFKLVGGV